MSAVPPPPQQVLFQLVCGQFATFTVRAFAVLGIADIIASGKTTTADICAELKGNLPYLTRFLRATTALGLTTQTGETVSLTPVGEALRKGVPGSMNSFAQALTSNGHVHSWQNLQHAVKTGEPASNSVFGTDIWTYFTKTNPEEGSLFTEAMTGLTTGIAFGTASVIASLPIEPTVTVADIGGASGILLQAILDRLPQAKGIIFDLPTVIADAKKALNEKYTSRVELVAGDFFVSVPHADIYTLKHIIHDWNDEEGVKILTTVVRSLNPGGYVILEEFIVEPVPSVQSALMDLNMMAVVTGRERTREEFEGLLSKAGLTLKNVVQNPAGSNTLVAQKTA